MMGFVRFQVMHLDLFNFLLLQTVAETEILDIAEFFRVTSSSLALHMPDSSWLSLASAL